MNPIVAPSESGNWEHIPPLVDKSQPVLTARMVIPPLSSKSDIPFLKTKIQDVKAFFATENFWI
jgi:hypothetical protein